jgi:hypothetical protein
VLDSERVVADLEDQVAQSHALITADLIALYKALGGGWELRDGQPVVPEATQAEMRARTNWGEVLSEPRRPETNQNPPPAKP